MSAKVSTPRRMRYRAISTGLDSPQRTHCDAYAKSKEDLIHDSSYLVGVVHSDLRSDDVRRYALSKQDTGDTMRRCRSRLDSDQSRGRQGMVVRRAVGVEQGRGRRVDKYGKMLCRVNQDQGQRASSEEAPW